MCSFAVFKNCQALKNTNGYPNKVWDKSKTTWAVGIAQLTHHSVHLEPRGELIAQYRPPMSFRYINPQYQTVHATQMFIRGMLAHWADYNMCRYVRS